jgi:DNA-binding NarL/FixJ family response regulator
MAKLTLDDIGTDSFQAVGRYNANNTKIETIRQLLQNPGIDGLVPILGDRFEYLHLQLAVYHVLNQSYHIPTLIKDKLDCKKKPALKQELGLTDRQKEIFELISDKGASNKVIANRLKITEGAVKSHVGKLLKKFGLRNRTELAALST